MNIDFEDMKWGSFTEQFNAYNRQHPTKKKKDLESFAKMILKEPSKFQERTKRRARFFSGMVN